MHGDADTHVNVSNTETLHNLMILQGTSAEMCKKKILPGLDHDEAVVPFMVEGVKFLINLRDNFRNRSKTPVRYIHNVPNQKQEEFFQGAPLLNITKGIARNTHTHLLWLIIIFSYI